VGNFNNKKLLYCEFHISHPEQEQKKFYPKFGKKILKNQISQRSSWNFHGHPKKIRY
jgi:hypothetical protein